MLLMVEKGIRSGICQTIHKYAKAYNKYMKNYDKNIESSYLLYLDANDLYRWGMSQKLPVNGFKWKKKNIDKFNEKFIKIMMRIVIKDIFLKWIFNILKILLIFKVIFHFSLKERKLKNAISLFVI